MKLNLTKNFQVLILVFLIILPFEKRHIFGNYQVFKDLSLYISDIIFAFTLLLGVYFTRNIHLNPWFKSFSLVFGLFLAFSLLLSPRETYNYYSFVKWLELLALAGLFSKLFQIKEYKILIIKGVIASGLIQGVIAIVQFIIQKSIGLKIFGESIIAPNINGIAKIDVLGEKFIRVYGTFAHPNQLAAFMLVACATCFYAYTKSSTTKGRILAGTILSVLIFGEFVSFSRVGLLGLYFVFAVMLLVLWQNVKREENNIPVKPTYLREKGVQLFLVIAITTIAAGSILMPFLKARAVLEAPAIYNRTLYDKAGLQIFKEHPVFGIGIGNIYNEMLKKVSHTEDWQVQVPHNYFILVADETGILGLGALLIFFVYLIYKLYKKIAEQGTSLNFYPAMLLAVLLAIIFLMQFDHYFYTLQQTQLLLWLVIGMILAEIPAAIKE